jgi:predicted metal-dependent hydrolase
MARFLDVAEGSASEGSIEPRKQRRITMLQLGKMQVETALFFESVEQIYARIFRAFRPRTAVPAITVRFRKYANANSRIRLAGDQLQVDISDLLECAPAPIQEALASILLAKLFRGRPDAAYLARYRHYLNRADFRRTLHTVKRERGRKAYRHARGQVYDLEQIFDELNLEYFHGLMSRPELGWSLRESRTTLGHYDPSHHVIILTRLLDSLKAPALLVRFVMFHEMLHLRYPTQHKGARRCVHTPEFKRAEREFTEYRAARLTLARFVQLGHA